MNIPKLLENEEIDLLPQERDGRYVVEISDKVSGEVYDTFTFDTEGEGDEFIDKVLEKSIVRD